MYSCFVLHFYPSLKSMKAICTLKNPAVWEWQMYRNQVQFNGAVVATSRCSYSIWLMYNYSKLESFCCRFPVKESPHPAAMVSTVQDGPRGSDMWFYVHLIWSWKALQRLRSWMCSKHGLVAYIKV